MIWKFTWGKWEFFQNVEKQDQWWSQTCHVEPIHRNVYGGHLHVRHLLVIGIGAVGSSSDCSTRLYPSLASTRGLICKTPSHHCITYMTAHPLYDCSPITWLLSAHPLNDWCSPITWLFTHYMTAHPLHNCSPIKWLMLTHYITAYLLYDCSPIIWLLTHDTLDYSA